MTPQPKKIAAQIPKQVGTGKAHSKIILLGEHAVVYGVPAIALPFPSTQVTATLTDHPDAKNLLISSYYTGPFEDMPESMANIQKVIELISATFNIAVDGLTLTIDSQIPVGRGMGSSAAVSVAIVRAFQDRYGFDLDDYQLQLLVNQAEVIAHESTSGLDTLMASTLDPVMYQKGEQPVPFKLTLSAHLIVADTGIEGQTKIAVGKVRQYLEDRPRFVNEALESIERFVKLGYQAIRHNQAEELGRLMTYNHYYLNQLEVSHPALDRIVNAAWYAGALGAKLTGGGLGGCAIALAKTDSDAEKIAQAMQSAGAEQTWILDLSTL